MRLSTSCLDHWCSGSPLVERGVLITLLNHLCRTQCLLPLDKAECERIADAHSRDEQRACSRVLARHFDITEHGRLPRPGLLYMGNHAQFQSAIDETASVTTESLRLSHPDNAQAQLPGVTLDDSHAARQKRYRDQIATLRIKVQQQGLTPRRAAGKQELLDMLTVTPGRDASVTTASLPRPSRADAHAGNTNTNTKYQYQEREKSVTHAVLSTSGGAAVLAMKAAGMPTGNPSSPRLQRLLDAGVTPEELADATRECVAAHKPLGFNYILAVVEGERRDAAAKATVPAAAVSGFEKWAGPEFMAAVHKRAH